jgi:putative heme-binding domain-containing protein
MSIYRTLCAATFVLCLTVCPLLKAADVSVPEDLTFSIYSDNTLTPCVASLGVAASGAVYVGVDQIGSLGKGGGKGRIIRLVDSDHDGVMDSHTVFAVVDNPRGIIPMGNKLYVLHSKWGEGKIYEGAFITVFTDADNDGVADGPGIPIVREISSRKFNQSRGVDHTTNGIRMGIDGWIYIAIGDFGFNDAIGRDGRKLTCYGGGVVRVRPDGSEMEMYVHGLRNIYDVAIDPRMNMFTRGNTNDGGGWNIRFIHEIQTGEYGYPVLFKRFTNEIIPALVDVGGGSGTGSMYFSEPGWPARYTNVPMMCDWGRQQLFIHRVTPDGASFTQEEEKFITCKKISDVDCDASGQLYMGSFNSGYTGGSGGFVARVVPKDWTYKAIPDLQKASPVELAALHASPSAKLRLAAQQALLENSKGKEAAKRLYTLAADKSVLHDSRIAAVFTLKQLVGSESHKALLELSQDASIREHALRAITDRTSQLDGVSPDAFVAALNDDNPRVQVAAAVALGRLGNASAASSLLAVTPVPDVSPSKAKVKSYEGYRSGIVEGSAVRTVDFNVRKLKNLYLLIGDGENGNGKDHGSWFEPVLVKKDGSELKLSELPWVSAKGGWGKTLVNKACTGAALQRNDGKPIAFGIGSHSPSVIHYKLPRDVVRFKASVGNSKGGGGAMEFFVNGTGLLPGATKANAAGPHATPNAAIILPHVAVKALVALDAAEACLAAIDGPNRAGALWALQSMYSDRAVDGLIGKLEGASDAKTRQDVAKTLVRLIHHEKPYNGDTWWGTRPDTRGPFYYPTPWTRSDDIKAALVKACEAGDDAMRNVIATYTEKDRAPIAGITKAPAARPTKKKQPKVNLNKIKNADGQVGKMGVEDVLIALNEIKGDPAKGKGLFTQQGCIACHTLDKSEPAKGPYMGQVGAIMNREQIAMAILRPNAEISQGFKTVMITMNDGQAHVGFVTERLNDQVEIRDIAGQVKRLKPADIKAEVLLEKSMMPEGLANGMSLVDFVSLVKFLESKKK